MRAEWNLTWETVSSLVVQQNTAERQVAISAIIMTIRTQLAISAISTTIRTHVAISAIILTIRTQVAISAIILRSEATQGNATCAMLPVDRKNQ